MFKSINNNKIYILFIMVISMEAAESGFGSLKIVPAAREAAMGGAGVASAQGPQAIYFNPAAISRYEKFSANVHYAKWFLDTHHQSFFLVRNAKIFNIGIGIVNFSYGKVEQREDKPTDEPIGYFDPQDFSLFLTLSRALDDRTAIGASGKFYYQKIFSNTASGGGIDVGLKFNLSSNILLGFSVINFGTMLRYQREKFWLPTEVKIGASYETAINNNGLVGTADLSYFAYDEKLSLGVGAEYALNDFLYLRGGYRPFSEAGKISSGFGVKLNNIRFEYSFSPYAFNLGTTHRFSIGFGY